MRLIVAAPGGRGISLRPWIGRGQPPSRGARFRKSRMRVTACRTGARRLFVTLSVMVDLAERYDVILRDGSTLRLRAPGAEDRDALLAFLRALSPESLYQRFHGIPSLTPALADRFLDP